MIQGDTGEYRVIQGDTGGYRGIQGDTGNTGENFHFGLTLKLQVQMSDLHTRRTLQRSDSTNVGLGQTSVQYKPWTSTNVGRIHL